MSAFLLVAVFRASSISVVAACSVTVVPFLAWHERTGQNVARGLPLRAAGGGVVIEPSLVVFVPLRHPASRNRWLVRWRRVDRRRSLLLWWRRLVRERRVWLTVSLLQRVNVTSACSMENESQLLARMMRRTLTRLNRQTEGSLGAML